MTYPTRRISRSSLARVDTQSKTHPRDYYSVGGSTNSTKEKRVVALKVDKVVSQHSPTRNHQTKSHKTFGTLVRPIKIPLPTPHVVGNVTYFLGFSMKRGETDRVLDAS
ncbi:hypothetical protein FOB58_004136 [Candida parapsilosis]|uniref:Uncharacterized protein n=1 Tax=Candida parapsilosis TaxID=5480 RepID=A0A8X7NJ15_CANPA|nr:hypothetical protein FOB58_004136 [Candida parapsilosis]KAF6046748.1 hypothetical protein FOB59_004213 [Candida parapsilosis]KAF6050811.1 hypothetical protein FOB60_003479 [Candida parapsilosis]KAF6062467.1 hypothetical protein FOB61_003897 [Candida parapsilosis]KAI5905102.1 hypothetical protein K4G60_g4360 [Candida parapsilosis]